ncbi:hypothetical protein CBM2586_A10284 [Cupriavidus phytorum]|uniref:Uncharacterized protein n=1 Tax=Cupriavidus taiwanensis TaxID=164546 RepID=A0A975WPM4_9BURK|nr:hypothetical protein CBM2586_A10284 [Cupriavidus taiwanensis]
MTEILVTFSTTEYSRRFHMRCVEQWYFAPRSLALIESEVALSAHAGLTPRGEHGNKVRAACRVR